MGVSYVGVVWDIQGWGRLGMGMGGVGHVGLVGVGYVGVWWDKQVWGGLCRGRGEWVMQGGMG